MNKIKTLFLAGVQWQQILLPIIFLVTILISTDRMYFRQLIAVRLLENTNWQIMETKNALATNGS